MQDSDHGVCVLGSGTAEWTADGLAKSESCHLRIVRKEGLLDHERNQTLTIRPVLKEANKNEDGERRRWNSYTVPSLHRPQKDTDTRFTQLLIRYLERKSAEIKHTPLDGDVRSRFQE